jgi:hypothetical protein
MNITTLGYGWTRCWDMESTYAGQAKLSYVNGTKAAFTISCYDRVDHNFGTIQLLLVDLLTSNQVTVLAVETFLGYEDFEVYATSDWVYTSFRPVLLFLTISFLL